MNAQPSLFGEEFPEPIDDKELRASARETYYETYDPDEAGCADCARADWEGERCRLIGKPVDIDYGTCECWKSKEVRP